MEQLNAFDKIDFFKFKEIFYTNPTLWKQLTSQQKTQHYWMMQRNIAIAYPSIMQHFNKVGMNALHVLNACHGFLVGQSQPRWSFISGKKQQQQSTDAVEDELSKFDDNIKKQFMLMNDIDHKTFDDYCKFHKADALEALKALKEELNVTKS